MLNILEWIKSHKGEGLLVAVAFCNCILGIASWFSGMSLIGMINFAIAGVVAGRFLKE